MLLKHVFFLQKIKCTAEYIKHRKEVKIILHFWPKYFYNPGYSPDWVNPVVRLCFQYQKLMFNLKSNKLIKTHVAKTLTAGNVQNLHPQNRPSILLLFLPFFYISSFPSGFLQLDLLLFLFNVAHILVWAVCLGALDLIICGPTIVQIQPLVYERREMGNRVKTHKITFIYLYAFRNVTSLGLRKYFPHAMACVWLRERIWLIYLIYVFLFLLDFLLLQFI